MKRGDMTKLILEELKANPRRTSIEIGEALGCRSGFVRSVACRNGISFGRRRKSDGRPQKQFYVAPDVENRKWLEGEIERLGVTASVILNALITDVRLEEEG
jgi:hypothetical protein